MNVLSSPVDRIRLLLVVLASYIVFVQFWILPVRHTMAAASSAATKSSSAPILQRSKNHTDTTNNNNRFLGSTTSISERNHTAIIAPSPTNNTKPWKRHSNLPVRLPYPIFVTSLPKSGTTSIAKYFKCGQQRASHTWIQRGKSSTLAGRCIRDNLLRNKPPFDHCGMYDVYSDTGYIEYDHDTGLDCFFPAVDGLEAIYDSYPHATFVHVIRDADAWYTSLQQWAHGSLFVRFRLCNATGFPNGQATRDDFVAMYHDHTTRIRQFVAAHPTLTYLEVQLESPDTGMILEQATGIDAQCWKDCKPDVAECATRPGDPPPKPKKRLDRKARREQQERLLRTVL